MMPDDALCARCGCFRSAHGEDERCEPVGWSFAERMMPDETLDRFNQLFQDKLYELIDSKANGLPECTVTEIVEVAAQAIEEAANG